MSYKFCPNCGHELIDVKTDSSWTRKQQCECGIEVNTTYGDAMGGSSDIVQVKRWDK